MYRQKAARLYCYTMLNERQNDYNVDRNIFWKSIGKDDEWLTKYKQISMDNGRTSFNILMDSVITDGLQ